MIGKICGYSHWPGFGPAYRVCTPALFSLRRGNQLFPAVKQDLASKLAERLPERGLRLTPIRLRVLEVFHTARRPLSVAQVYFALGQRAADLATVYRTVRAFEKTGLIERVCLSDGLARYLATFHSERHTHAHYLICEVCHDVQMIHECCNKWTREEGPAGFLILGHRLEIFGICEGCRQKREEGRREKDPLP